MDRTARCSCGALVATAHGEPIKISACHCVACQRRTGSAFSVAVFYQAKAVEIAGRSETFERLGDSGQPVEFHFCRTCASTLFWLPQFRPGWIGIAIGCFDDRTLAPTQAVYDQDERSWVRIALATR